MRTKNTATISAVVFGLTAALMAGTALSTSADAQQTGTQDQDQTSTQDRDQDQTDTPDQDQDQTATQDRDQDQTDTPDQDQDQDQTATQDQDQTDTQTEAPTTGVAETEDDTTTPDTGVAEDADPMAPATGVADDADSLTPDTGVAGDAGISPDTGMAANDGLPRRSVSDSAEPYAGEVMAGITADQLIGMNVVDATGESVGSVTDLLLGDNDQVDHAIIDVGGFLGFGAKSVAIPLDELTIAEGDSEVVLNTTRDELDAMPEWSRGDDGWMSN